MVLRLAPQQTLEAEIAHLRSNTVPMTTHKQVLEAKVSEAIADVKRQMVEEMATKVRLCCVWLYGAMGGVLTAAAAHYSATTSGGAAVQRVPNNACNAAQGTPLRVRARTAFSPPSRTLTHPRCCIARWHPECGDA